MQKIYSGILRKKYIQRTLTYFQIYQPAPTIQNEIGRNENEVG